MGKGSDPFSDMETVAMQLSADEANQQMVDRLISEEALWSRPLIAAFRATPRHRFLDRVFQFQRKHNRWREILTRDPGPEEIRLLYSDRALITHLSPASRDQPALPVSSSSQPSLMAQMLEDLQLQPDVSVLEIGAGTGYNSALLAHVVGPGQVVSIDVDKEVLLEAWEHLRAFPERRIGLKHADGRSGFTESAPYERIMVTAATPDIEPAWLEQIVEGGVLLAPLALAPGLAFVACGTVRGGVFEARLTRPAYFMPLRAEGETGVALEESFPRTDEVYAVPAPWAGWFDRKRPRATWLGFIQALVVYGLLRGLAIHYQTLASGESTYGVSDQGCLCWLGSRQWWVHGESSRDLGWTLWRAFLDAGGPRPTEFRLRAAPHLSRPAGLVEQYFRQGPRCGQTWELIEPRVRPAWF